MNTEDKRQNPDLTDPQKDQAKLKPDVADIELPEVKDIPGQERISPIPLRGLSDITPSSSDEEGVGIVDNLNKLDDDEDLIVTGTDTDISSDEVAMLESLDGLEASADNQNLVNAGLDRLDMEDEELNEDSFGEDLSGKDLDVEPATLDDDMEEIGEEDEENNIFSTDDDDEE